MTFSYLARAFFPSTSRSGREILVELGHTIGFRHEHTRPESDACFENSQWRALTAYDAGSVMHYPQCNGSNNGDLTLTNADQAGASALY